MKKTEYNNLYALVISLGLILILSGCADQDRMYELSGEEYSQEESQVEFNDTETEYDTEPVKAENIFVYICGCVTMPGVYELPAGSRLYEVLQRAGGYTSEAADTYLNQADVLLDGEKIYVPSFKELNEQNIDRTEQTPERKGVESAAVNINTADLDKLQTISGIGLSRAKDIVSYRESNGLFNTIEDIMRVPGIKEGLFSKIKEQITVRD